MTEIDIDAVERALDALPGRFKGPGGVAGLVKDGRIVAARAWGYADLGRRLPMTASTRLPICSISKQFTCAVLLDTIGDPAALDGQVRAYLPAYTDPLPSVRQLCDMQSGLRDTWALTVLHGATPEAEFRRSDALPLIARMKTGHFAPGSSYSYSNGNFRILGEMLERATGRSLSDLYRARIFDPAGMATATLTADTRFPEDGVTGYEGTDATGFFPAANGITWIGDAGISASLADMLAWESFIDATRDDPAGLYRRLTAPPSFADDTPAAYGYGLRRDTVAGLGVTGHGGALRGFRAHRHHAADARLSAVVIFNHEANAFAAAAALIEAAVGYAPTSGAEPGPAWDGTWLDAEAGLIARTVADRTGVALHYAATPARLTPGEDGTARGAGLALRLSPDGLTMERPGENRRLTALPVTPAEVVDGAPLAGRYWSDELEAALVIAHHDGATFAGFDGVLGTGPMERMYLLTPTLGTIATRRSMDAPAPGDWTVAAETRPDGMVTGLMVGCWLARGIRYRPV